MCCQGCRPAGDAICLLGLTRPGLPQQQQQGAFALLTHPNTPRHLSTHAKIALKRKKTSPQHSRSNRATLSSVWVAHPRLGLPFKTPGLGQTFLGRYYPSRLVSGRCSVALPRSNAKQPSASCSTVCRAGRQQQDERPGPTLAVAPPVRLLGLHLFEVWGWAVMGQASTHGIPGSGGQANGAAAEGAWCWRGVQQIKVALRSTQVPSGRTGSTASWARAPQ